MPPGHENSPRNESVLIYILCPDEETRAHAEKIYTWNYARFITLPEDDNKFLESVIFMQHLPALYDEWKDAEFVGCISHSSIKKQPLISKMDDVLEIIREEQSDFCALMYRGDALVATAEKWHPGFTTCWEETWSKLGWDRETYMSPNTPSFYCNYFITTPHLMKMYCLMTTYLRFWFDNDSQYRNSMCIDSNYDDRGPDIAKIPMDKKTRLFGLEWYPMSIFVCERLPCVFFSKFAKKKLMIR